ncbi:MAG TPA: DEAD/DEAH box helicase, partial [Candidatus Eisenbacteria bacterium]|nr:DEAD/DEAH box helicase [Candidatus Eisenbacteria bacterium]
KPAMQEAAARVGWTSLMPVQAKAIPYLLAKRDLMIQSRTGSGKTGAFILPLFELLDPSASVCQALVLVPTRELARQVAQSAEDLFQSTGFRVAAVYGGVGYGAQREALRRGAHLVVGTPGRILDHLVQRTMNLDRLRFLVFDEADRMLSVGFYPDMRSLKTYMPESRQGSMFSATFPATVRSLAKEFLRQPEMLSLSHGHEHVAETEHIAYEVPGMEKDRSLVRIIEIEMPESAIVFCNTRADANFVSVVLQRFGYDADQLSSDLPQAAREKVLGRLYEHKLRFLVATDVAARGIDIANLTHVFLYDFPEDPESYIHRTGRTGRAGASGEAISLVDPMESLRLKAVARNYNIPIIFRPLPTEKEVESIVSQRVTALLETRLRNLDRLVVERMQRMVPLARGLGEDDDEVAVMAMLLDDFYQKSLHALPELPGGHTPPAKAERKSESGGGSAGGGSGGGGSGGGSGRRRGGSRRRKR